MFNYEEQLLNNIDPEEQCDHIEQAIRYKNSLRESTYYACHGTEEYVLAGATGTNYESTAKLNVMNYK